MWGYKVFQDAPAENAPAEIRLAVVVDLLGMLALGELFAFDQVAVDARLAPDLRRRAVLGEMAAREIANYTRLAERLGDLGVDPQAAMEPFVAPLRDYHQQTTPSDWYEALTKTYVGDSLADDFIRVTSALLEGPDRDLIHDVLHDCRHAEFAADELRAAITADPKLANRLSMWGRRLVGEGISQALRVAAERPSLAELLMAAPELGGISDLGGTSELGSQSGLNGAPGAGGIPGLLKCLTAAHTGRMAAVGLNN